MRVATRTGGLVLAMLVCAPAFAQATTAGAGTGPNDAQIQGDVLKALDNKRFKDVKSAVDNGIVTLTGSVSVYSAKDDADKRVHHRKNVKAVQNLIEVQGPPVEDATLRNKLAESWPMTAWGTARRRSTR